MRVGRQRAAGSRTGPWPDLGREGPCSQWLETVGNRPARAQPPAPPPAPPGHLRLSREEDEDDGSALLV